MYKEKSHSPLHRIVSIHPPRVCQMVRGKQGKNVEFGAKINLSLQNGYAPVDKFDFETFNEGAYFKEQIERYKKLNGHYPELVRTDDIYMNREKRKYLKENDIRHAGRPLERKPKIELPKLEKQIQRFKKKTQETK